MQSELPHYDYLTLRRGPRKRLTSTSVYPNSPEIQTLQNRQTRSPGPRAGPPGTPKRGPQCPGPGCGAARRPAAGSGAGGGVQGDFGKPAPAAAASAASGRRACTARPKVCFCPNACSGGARDACETRCCSALLGSSPCVRATAPVCTAPMCACHRDLLCAPAAPQVPRGPVCILPPEWRSRCTRARRAVAARCCGPQTCVACGWCSPWGTGRTPCGGGAPRAHAEGWLAACPQSLWGLDGCIRTGLSRCMRCRRPRLLQFAPHSHSKLSRQKKGLQRRAGESFTGKQALPRVPTDRGEVQKACPRLGGPPRTRPEPFLENLG